MRRILIAWVLFVVVASLKTLSQPICFEETDDEICESFGTQCGVTVHVEDGCGVSRTVDCNCDESKECILETLKCH